MGNKANVIREESIKLKVAYNFFQNFDCTNIEENIDFTVTENGTQKNFLYEAEKEYYLWAEAKRPYEQDIYVIFTQLILTIGKSSRLRNLMPPKYLGAFNSEKIAFIEYSSIYEVFSLNDVDWTTPSNHKTEAFKKLYTLIKQILTGSKQPNIFNFEKDEKELKKFIKNNFKKDKKGTVQIEVTKANFVHVYRRWLDEVKNTINIDWDIAKKNNILDVDFFFADLFSEYNKTIKNELNAILKETHYEYNRQENTGLGINVMLFGFKDNQKAHTNFWLKYKRPPKNTYQNYILERRELLVPQDIREIKGAYFTPQIWVQKSQEYLTEYLGENWQEEYYIWDCCAGTGNMENGLTNKYNVWASTLDKSDVDIMKDRIKNGANLLESHVFQFDFLKDEFEDKCPKDLLDIIQDKEKRKKLIIYINPPYAEVSSIGKKGKKGVNNSRIHDKYSKILGTAGREVYAPFLCRIYFELKGALIAEFSKLKLIQSPAFDSFREYFKPKLEKMFIAQSYTFDNVGGNFPIGFKIWNPNIKEKFKSILCEVYSDKGDLIGRQIISLTQPEHVINRWITRYKPQVKLIEDNKIGFLCGTNGNDFQQNRIVYIYNRKEQMANPRGTWITPENLIECSIYLTVRRCIEKNWTNDRTQYTIPNEKWETDKDFQSDCFTMALFINDIKSSEGKNHWIPYTEQEVDAKNSFESHFMTDYIKEHNIKFSEEAQRVLDAGKELYKYYHSKADSNPNASFYDIRMYFQGTNEKGKMNAKSEDEEYSMLLFNLRQEIKRLSEKIIPKIYEYGFLNN